VYGDPLIASWIWPGDIPVDAGVEPTEMLCPCSMANLTCFIWFCISCDNSRASSATDDKVCAVVAIVDAPGAPDALDALDTVDADGDGDDDDDGLPGAAVDVENAFLGLE